MDLYQDHIDNKVLIRELNEERDMEDVEKLERDCTVGSKKGLSIFTNMMGDPLCRVAELVGNGELVGVVRGCMKCVGAGLRATHVKMGSIIGLRVSPKHRRLGIGLKLVKSIEGWAIRNGAQYISSAMEENNVASTNLFVLKSDYVKFRSLVIYVQPIDSIAKNPSQEIKIEKLGIDQAISLYKDRLGGKEFFPMDISAILNEELSLGTWVSFFREEDWGGLQCNAKDGEFTRETPNSWAMMSMWKTYEAYKLHVRGTHLYNSFHASISQIRAKVFSCLRLPINCDMPLRPFGFLFLYGLHGEGERVGELMKSLWWFAYNLAREVKDCGALVSELGVCDPLRGHVPHEASLSCINDLLCLKTVNGSTGNDNHWTRAQPLSSLFVDPRDF